jgi:hypothetical protein
MNVTLRKAIVFRRPKIDTLFSYFLL